MIISTRKPAVIAPIGRPKKITQAKILLKTVDAFFIKPLHEVIALNHEMRVTRRVQCAIEDYAQAEKNPNKYWHYEYASYNWTKAALLAGLEGKMEEKQTHLGSAQAAHEKWLKARATFETDTNQKVREFFEGSHADGEIEKRLWKNWQENKSWSITEAELTHAIAGIEEIFGKRLSPEGIVKMCNDVLNANLSPKMKIIFYLELASAHAELGNVLEKERALLEVKRLQKAIEQGMDGKLEK